MRNSMIKTLTKTLLATGLIVNTASIMANEQNDIVDAVLVPVQNPNTGETEYRLCEDYPTCPGEPPVIKAGDAGDE